MRQDLARGARSLTRLEICEASRRVAHGFAASIRDRGHSVPQQFPLRIGRRNILDRIAHGDQITLVLQETKSMERKVPSESLPTASAHARSVTPAAGSGDNAQLYRWGVDCDAWYLVNDEQLSVIEEFMPPGAAEIRRHHDPAQPLLFLL